LSGPRWRIGERDLAVLGRRAVELARQPRRETPVPDLMDELADAVAETDDADVVSLLEAIDDPGEAPLSPAAAARLAQFSDELETLRQHAAEPVLDQVRRVISVLGLDVELHATADSLTARRADHLGAFVDAVAEYVDVDGDTTLSGLLAWLQAEIEHGVGLEQATPSERDSVKLLTVHRAKGLEWDLVVLPSLTEKVFPSDRLTDNWVTTAAVIPAELRGDADSVPLLGPPSDAGFGEYVAEQKQANRLAEDRLAYVAITRARRELVATHHRTRPGLSEVRGASPYWLAIAAEAESQGTLGPVADADVVSSGQGEVASLAWPVVVGGEAHTRRLLAAELVEQARTAHQESGQWPEDDLVSLDEVETVAEWDHRISQMLAEVDRRATAGHEVVLPESLSATALVGLKNDPATFAAQLVRPMPRPVNPAATLGSRFHAWVERHHGPTHLSDPLLVDEDDVVTDDEHLAALVAAFEASEWAQRVPVAVEVPFVMAVGAHVVRGKIDAVHTGVVPGHAFTVVDWKTSDSRADELQLALYRLAWATSRRVPLEQVDACFVHVRSGRVHRPHTWAGLDEIEAWLDGGSVLTPAP